MQHLETVVQGRYKLLIASRACAIENTVVNTNSSNSIETGLPEEIESLIDDKKYRPRYLKLVRDGYLDQLLAVAQLARKQAVTDPPSHWFATACSKRHWESQTLPFLAKLAQVQQAAEEAIQRVGDALRSFVYHQAWRGLSVERFAVQAQELGRSPGAYFRWLCTNMARY